MITCCTRIFDPPPAVFSFLSVGEQENLIPFPQIIGMVTRVQNILQSCIGACNLLSSAYCTAPRYIAVEVNLRCLFVGMLLIDQDKPIPLLAPIESLEGFIDLRHGVEICPSLDLLVLID